MDFSRMITGVMMKLINVWWTNAYARLGCSISIIGLCLVLWGGIGFSQSAFAVTTPEVTPSPTSQSPEKKPEPAASDSPQSCRLGIYLVSLSDFSMADKSFNADFWTWSVCPSKDLKPLESMEVVNSKSVNTAYNSVEEKLDQLGVIKQNDKIYWTQQKVVASLRHDWKIENFPFDRQTLEIPIEETKLDSTAFNYIPDIENSSYRKDMAVDGWRITNFKVVEKKVTYQSTFGNPDLKAAGESNYSRVSILISMTRDNKLTFLKLIAGVYAAFATILLAFFHDGKEGFGSRTSLLVGSLFTVLISMKGVNAVLGESNVLTMVDAIHITTLGYLIAAVLVAFYSRHLCEKGQSKKAARLDRRIYFSIFAISFAIFNIVMIVNALIVG
jgi:hypothetical protein